MQKGYFPHLFNKIENQNYIGLNTSKDYYGIDSMKSDEREKFIVWHDEQEQARYLFDFQEEIVHYCKQDVNILRRACILFRQEFLDCSKVCPFSDCTTIASTCLRVFRTNYLKENTIGIIPRNGYRMTNKQSVKALNWLSWMERVLDRKIQFSARGKELRLPEGFLVDGFSSSRNGKDQSIVLQYHGCWFHGCPLCFKFNRDAKFMGGRDTIEDKFQQTMRISQKIKRAGYNLIEVWECEIDREILANAEMHEFMESNELVKIKPLDPRDCFFGGRVENTAKYLEGDMKYFDIRSLYPFVCKTGEYPIGHPTIYIGKECQKLTGSKNDDITNVHGIVKCNVLPPRDLYHPVLPVRMHGKLLFPLCRTCCEQSFQRECCHENV